MSDNVIIPPQWVQNAERSLSNADGPIDTPLQLGGGGGGPQIPSMEPRVVALEADMKDVKAGIGRLEVGSATLGGRIDTLTERLHAHGETLARVEGAIRDLGSKVDAKLVSGVQMFGIFAGLMSLFLVLGGIAIGALRFFKLLP